MNAELFTALDLLEKEKGIPKAYMYGKIEAALVAAYKKEYGNNTNVRVEIDETKRDVRVYQQKEIVEEVEDPEIQMNLEDAKKISKRYKLGDIAEIEVKTKNMRRLSAANAKSVIVQGIREGERLVAQEAYENKKEEIISATVWKVDRETGNVVLETDNGRAVLTRAEQIPGEVLQEGDVIKVYVSEVKKEARGPLVTLSRSNAGLVKRLFELEVPEIADGIVLVRGVAREAGSRTKLSVMTRDEAVDPVGACIGNRGNRINSIVEELGGEKIDIIPFREDLAEYVAAALSPAEVLSIVPAEDKERSFRVAVAPEQLSLAIGKEGQNVRLAARLTGCRIDIKAE